MKKVLTAAFLVAIVLPIAFAKGKVKRVDEVSDIDGYWNDNDIKIVCEDLINQAINSPRVAKFEEENGRAPTVVLGKIKNDSLEHIDTTIISKKFQNAIINSGVMEFVADKSEREELEDEVAYQQEHSTTDTAKEMNATEAADFMLQGSVKADVHKNGKLNTRAYLVTIQLMNLQTHRIIFSGENDSVKKEFKQKKTRA